MHTSGEDRLWNRRFSQGHTPYRRVSLIDLYLHTGFHSNRINAEESNPLKPTVAIWVQL